MNEKMKNTQLCVAGCFSVFGGIAWALHLFSLLLFESASQVLLQSFYKDILMYKAAKNKWQICFHMLHIHTYIRLGLAIGG